MWYCPSFLSTFPSLARARTDISQSVQAAPGEAFTLGATPCSFHPRPTNPSGILHWSNASKERSQQPSHSLARGGELRDLALALYLRRWLSGELREGKARSKQTNKQIWLFPAATAKGAGRLRARQAKPRPDSPLRLPERAPPEGGVVAFVGGALCREGAGPCLAGAGLGGAGRGLGVGGVGSAGRSAPTALSGATRAAAPRQAGFT